MRRLILFALASLVVIPSLGWAQVGGNITFSQSAGRARAEQRDASHRVLSDNDMPPDDDRVFVDAAVLYKVRPDAYVATFAVARDGKTVAECNRNLETTLTAFTAAVKALGVEEKDLFVDFVAQNRIYGFDIEGNTAREKLVGFEVKKNVVIHYRDRDLLDKLLLAAANVEIFDLIKVDTVVLDAAAVQDQLMEAAAKIIKRKTARYEKLLGTALRPPAQIFAERYGRYDPSGLYDSYTAFESERVAAAVDRQRFTILSARKSQTFFYNGLDGNGFDEIVNPVVTEPPVQFTLYLKVSYEIVSDEKK
jgi:uncharacterized protein YggE